MQKIWIENGTVFISCYNDRPGKLFEGLEHIRLSIVLLKRKNNKLENGIFSTEYYKWNTIAGEQLFDNLYYNEVTSLKEKTLIPKLNNKHSKSILEKIQKNKKSTSSYLVKSSSHIVYFTRKLSGFVQILNLIPKIYDESGELGTLQNSKN